MKRKNLGKRIATLATVSVLAASSIPVNVFAYGEEVTDISGETKKFVESTENSDAYKTWKSTVWDAGESADSGKMALTPGDTEADLNFAWYSETKGFPAVKVWKVGEESSAKIVRGTATVINATNVQGSTYEATNHVSIEGYFEADTAYQYQYTDNYDGSATTWSATYDYNTADTEEFSVILTGDPQVGASGSTGQGTDDDQNIARDTYNWDKTMAAAMALYPDAAFLLSAGDQVDYSTAQTDPAKAIRESEYAGYLYPEVFRSLPVATTIGNHDTNGIDYSYHFNNPNSEDSLGATEAGSDYYFSYGDVLFISLNSNNRNQEEHRALMTKAAESNPDAKWKVVIFHSDIYGSGQPHADTDATANRIIFAPLMDEFDIDICLTGHDHTYSRSYQILDGNVIDYDISDGSVTNPEGTLYVSTGSGSGSKYYNLLNYTPYFIADRTNVCLPAFSALEFTEDSLTIKTYDYNGDQYAESFTIKKTDSQISVDEVIEQAEAKLADTETEYTAESLSKLQSALATLKALKAAYTTAEDTMVDELTTNYRTSDDRCRATKADGSNLGYGQIANDEDKDTVNGSTVQRFKAGISTLLDKTIYSQISNGEEIANATLPIVDADTLEAAKVAVSEAIINLEVPKAEPTTEATTDPTTTAPEATTTTKTETTTTVNTEDTTSSKSEEATTTANTATTNSENESSELNKVETGDNSNIFIYAAGMLVAAGAGLMIFRKKEEDCETR